MRVVVDSRIRFRPPTKAFADAVIKACTNKNPKHAKLKAMGRPAWNEPRTYCSAREEPEGMMSVARGRMAELRAVTKDHGRNLSVTDWTVSVPFAEAPELAVDLRWYQDEAIAAAMKSRVGLVRLCTGSGKTVISLGLICATGEQTLVIVDTGAQQKQWIAEAEDKLVNIDRRKFIGKIGGGVFDPKPLTVAMQQTLNRLDDRKWAELTGRFGLIIGEECGSFGAKSFQDSIDRFPVRYRIGVSADHRRPDGKHFLVNDQFGPVIYEVSRGALEDEGHVLKVPATLVQTGFKASWYRLPGADKGNWTRLVGEMTTDPDRNVMIAELIGERSLAGEGPWMVFSSRVEHCRELAAMLDGLGVKAGLMVGGVENSIAFERTKEGLSNGKVSAAVGTLQAIGKAIDVPAVSRGLLAVPVRNRQSWGQARGRLARTGTADAELVVMWDRSVFGDRMVRNAMTWNDDAVDVLDDDRGKIAGKVWLDKGRKRRR